MLIEFRPHHHQLLGVRVRQRRKESGIDHGEYGALLAPLPYPNPQQLVMVWSKFNQHRHSVSAADYLDWKRQSSVFQDLIALSGTRFTLSSSEHPEVLRARITSPGFFDVQGIPLLLGRDFLPEEATAGRDHVVIMTHQLWQQRFAGNTHILGQQLWF